MNMNKVPRKRRWEMFLEAFTVTAWRYRVEPVVAVPLQYRRDVRTGLLVADLPNIEVSGATAEELVAKMQEAVLRAFATEGATTHEQ